jgi:regulator of protease activity HflC (stomatin/prohibitin superfamily)
MTNISKNTRDKDMQEVGHWGQAVALSFRFLLVGAAAVAVGWLVSNIRQVPPDSQAVVLRLGAVARVQGPGLLIAWPKPIEQVVLVPASARQIQFAIGRFAEGQAPTSVTDVYGYELSETPRLNSGFLLSGDSSVVHLEARVFYQITDAQSYMIATDHIAPALQRIFITSAVDTIAARDLDTILVARPEIASRGHEAMRREQLRADLMNAVNRRLENLDQQGAGLGIRLSRVDLVPSIPMGAKEAFDSVLVVTQQSEADIANSRTLSEIETQSANRSRDRIQTDATAKAEETVSTAKVATASITALAANTQNMSHATLMSRLYYDRIGPIIKRAGHLKLLSPDGTTRLIIPGAYR